MGSAISSLFGGGYSAPEPVQYDPVPDSGEAEPAAKTARDEERRKIRARRGLSGTLLTSPLGTGAASSGSSGLLGRV